MPVFILAPVIASDLHTSIVKHTHRPEEGVRKLWHESIGVGGGEDAVDNDVTSHGVRVVKAVGPLCRYGCHVSCGNHIADLNSTGGLKFAVYVQVVARS